MKRKFWSLLLVLALLVGILPVTALAVNAPIVVVAGEELIPGQYIDNEGTVGSYEDRPASGYAAYVKVKDDDTAVLELNGYRYEGDGQLLDYDYPNGSIAAAFMRGFVFCEISAAIYAPCPLEMTVIGDCSLDLNALADSNFKTERNDLTLCTRGNCGIVSDEAISILGTKDSSLAFNEIHTGIVAHTLLAEDLTLTCGSYLNSLLLTGTYGPSTRSMKLQNCTVTVENTLEGELPANCYGCSLFSYCPLTLKGCTVDIDNARLALLSLEDGKLSPANIVIEDSDLTLTNCGDNTIQCQDIVINDSKLTLANCGRNGIESEFHTSIIGSTVDISNTGKLGIFAGKTYEQTNSVVRIRDTGIGALVVKPGEDGVEPIKLNGSYLLLQGEKGALNYAPILSEAMQHNRASVNLDGSDSAPFDPEKLQTYHFAEFGVEPDVEPGGRPDAGPDIDPEIDPDLPLLPFLPLLGAGSPFPDVQPSDWFYEYVCTLHNREVLDGYPDGTFKPQNNVTNGEAVKMVLEAVGYGYQEPTGSHWASGYLAAARRDGLIGDVSPDAPISRLEMAHLVARALNCPKVTGLDVFADCQDGYVLALYECYVLEGSYDDNGVRVFKPYDNLTRAEFAAILYRI